MGINHVRCSIDEKKFYFSVTKNGNYNVCVMDNGEILLSETDWELSTGLEYFLLPWSKNGLRSPELSISAFGKFGNFGDKKLKFIHIPKTGGTSIENFGFFHGFKWGKVDKKYYNKFKTTSPGSIWHATLPTLPDEFYEGYDKFCVVRNPYDRILSSVYCGFRSDYPVTKEDFNLEIKTNILSNQNIHYAKQFDYVYKNDKKVVQHVLKFETLKTDLENLLLSYGIESNFNIKSNQSHPKKYTSLDFTTDTLELINKVYFKDFETFGYEIKKPTN